MTTPSSFLERMQPVINALPEGADKDKLLTLMESQDATERDDVHPRERVRALRRLQQIEAQSRRPGQTP